MQNLTVICRTKEETSIGLEIFRTLSDKFQSLFLSKWFDAKDY